QKAVTVAKAGDLPIRPPSEPLDMDAHEQPGPRIGRLRPGGRSLPDRHTPLDWCLENVRREALVVQLRPVVVQRPARVVHRNAEHRAIAAHRRGEAGVAEARRHLAGEAGVIILGDQPELSMPLIELSAPADHEAECSDGPAPADTTQAPADTFKAEASPAP